MPVKELVKQVMDQMPDDANLDEVMQAIYLAAKIQKGEQEMMDGKGIPHEVAMERLNKWVR